MYSFIVCKAVRMLDRGDYQFTSKLLGSGTFGKVVKGRYHGPAAIKVINLKCEQLDMKMLRSEVEIAR